MTEPTHPGQPGNVQQPNQPTAAVDIAHAAKVVPHVPGRLTEAYDVSKPVGKGGYAVVYKGIRREDGRVVAVKKVEIFEMTQKKRERCLQEVTLLSQLSHPYVIQMLDAFIDENMLIIIFEWAPAGDLKRLIKKTAEAGKTLDETAIWGFFAQITDALRYMHQQRIMHRDIKPANVLVGANGALKLGDLGLGRQLSEQTMEAFSKVGTPYYVSPEVVRGAGYDWKSDVWSLGCLLYELACLRSPFEMEGANLYDVFQKISKGEYTPLPADAFSPTLRQLVVRMLSVDPAKRPEVEEVWSITQRIVSQQSKLRQDVHAISEHLFGQLILMEAEAARIASSQAASTSGRGSTPPTSTPTKHRGHHGSGGNSNSSSQGALQPPSDTLHMLHPLFFAEPLSSMPATGGASLAGLQVVGDDAQKLQLGVLLHIMGWLLRLGGRGELAPTLEEHIDMRQLPTPRRTQHYATTAPQGAQSSPPKPALTRIGSSGSTSSAGRSSRSRMAAAAAAEGATANGAANPVPPPPPKLIPICSNLLKGAEAAKKAAQALGLSTEFAAISALSSGYGRAVCSLLQDMLDLATRRVPLMARKPQRQAEPEVEDVEEVDTLDGEDVSGTGADGALLTVASPLPAHIQQALNAEELEDGGEGAYFGNMNRGAAVQAAAHSHGSGRTSPYGDRAASSLAGGTSTSGRAAAAVSGGRESEEWQRRRPIFPSANVDPVAWRAEVERLGPQLSRIKISSAAAGTADVLGDWNLRWDKTKEALRGMQAEAPSAAAALQRLGAAVGTDLDRIGITERRVNGDSSVASALQLYAASRGRMQELQQDVAQHEELAQIGNNAIAQVNAKLEELQARMQARTNELDGSLQVKQIQDAIKRLKREVAHMDVQMGVLRQQLAAKQRRDMQVLHGGLLEDTGDLEDDGG